MNGDPADQPAGVRRILWVGVCAGLSLALLVCAAVAFQAWELGSTEGGWTYNYVRPFRWDAVIVGVPVAVVFAAIVALAGRIRRHALFLSATILIATAGHWWIRSLAPYDIETVFLSRDANSFYTMSQERGPGEILARFNRVRRQAPPHARSNMPGKTILMHALELVTTRTNLLPIR